MSVDYPAMNKRHRVLKSQLTRALNKMDAAERQEAVLKACRAALAEWREWGMWPDDWARWNRALSDVGLWLTMDDLR